MRDLERLRTSSDMLAKLRHDLSLLEESPSDSYLAFNFFVTAEHMGDWVLPGKANRANREQLRDENLVLQVCSHLANGLKHFETEAKHHKSVVDTKTQMGYADEYYGDYGKEYYGSKILVTLDGEAASEFGERVAGTSLARKTLDFWEQYVSQNSGQIPT